MAELTTRDGVTVAPGTELYWLEPGTTQVLGSPTYTRDLAMTRWSSPVAALDAAIEEARRLEQAACDDLGEAHKRIYEYKDFASACRLALLAPVPITAVPPADKPEECR